MTKLAVFDLDDTLVDSTGAIDAWFVELARDRDLGDDGLAFLRAEQDRPVTPAESFLAIVERFDLCGVRGGPAAAVPHAAPAPDPGV